MKRHKFTKWNKERISVYASAALVLGVCVVSGIYATNEAPSKTQIIDMESLDENNLRNAGEEGLADANQANDDAAGETVMTNGDSESPMPAASSLAEEYANRAKEQQESFEESADLTGDAELPIQDEIVPTTAKSKTKVTEQELHFNPQDGMSWPVQGNVILDYSMDERAYLATLNEYRYYPAIAISAPQDTSICAAAKGKVTNLGYNEEIGQYVTMDLGDGYSITYGQLKDANVEIDDIVSCGQIIGSVAEPTKYYTIEGSNLYVKMEHDGESMDPVLYFQ